MKAPRDQTVIQIDITNACNHHCSNCTRFCGFHKKPFFMKYETFCKAVDTLLDRPGMIGVMGGEPTLHPRFADMCQYLYEKLPKEKLADPKDYALPTDSFMDVRRFLEKKQTTIHTYADGPHLIKGDIGLWTTMTTVYRKNFEIIQNVFNFQSLNDHTNASYHQPILISRKDMRIGDDEWIKLREKCWVNQNWSGSITPKGCFFCEVAAAMDMLFDGPGGLPIEKDWWKRDIEDFKEQFRWCELCGIPLKTFARDAREGIMDISAENLALLKESKTAQYIPERLNVVEIQDGIISEKCKKAAANYHGISYLQDGAERVSLSTPIYMDSFVGVVLCKNAEEYEQNKDLLKKNQSYMEELYVIVAGKVYLHFARREEMKGETEKQQSLLEFLRKQKEGTYFLFMTPGIELGAGFEKLKKCVVNPGTLHMVDFDKGQGTGNNPYIANADTLQGGGCALLNNNALSLVGMEQDVAFSLEGLQQLWQLWQPEKRVELSAKMDARMWGADDSKHRHETKRRRQRMAINYYLRLLREYGLPTVLSIGIKSIKIRGLDEVVNRFRGKIL